MLFLPVVRKFLLTDIAGSMELSWLGPHAGTCSALGRPVAILEVRSTAQMLSLARPTQIVSVLPILGAVANIRLLLVAFSLPHTTALDAL